MSEKIIWEEKGCNCGGERNEYSKIHDVHVGGVVGVDKGKERKCYKEKLRGT